MGMQLFNELPPRNLLKVCSISHAPQFHGWIWKVLQDVGTKELCKAMHPVSMTIRKECCSQSELSVKPAETVHDNNTLQKHFLWQNIEDFSYLDFGEDSIYNTIEKRTGTLQTFYFVDWVKEIIWKEWTVRRYNMLKTGTHHLKYISGWG